MKTVYVCEGTCKAKISEEQYKGGLTVCGAPECNLKGHPFAKKYECEQCGSVVSTPTEHSHTN